MQPYDVVITGASGFLGGALMNQLSELGIQVKGLSRRNIKGLSFVSSYNNICSSSNSILVHLAQQRDASVISEGDEVQVCHKLASGNWKHIIYASSAVIYGDLNEYASRPDEHVSATSIYTKVKLDCEAIITAAGGTCMRFSNLYGPLMDSSTVLSHILKQIPGKGDLIVRDTIPVRDFLWIDDAAKCLALAAIVRPGGILNAGSGTGFSIGDLAQILLGLAGEDNRQVVSSALGNRPSYLVLDIDKTRSILKWSPEVNIKDGLLQLLKLKMNNG
jgi:UDP-glucose 4-epimerase